MTDALRTIDLFCGGGGLSQGLINAGMKVVSALDNWPEALDFYGRNIPGHDVVQQDLSNVEQTIQILRGYEPDVIAGGPPCQDFSSAGKRDETGSRANLTLSFASIIDGLRPAYFIMENVDRAQKTKTFERAVEMFNNCGYGISETVLDSSLCGVPQRRKRVIVVGILNGPHNALVSIIKKRQGFKPMTVREYFGDRLKIDHYYRHPRSYQRRGVFSVDEPSPTIRGVNRPVPSGYRGHPGDTTPINDSIRPLTTKERSLIQTFPDCWDISGNKTVIEQIIGNAVPVKLAEFVARCLLEYLKNPLPHDAKTDNSANYRLFEQKRLYSSRSRKGNSTALVYE